VPSKDANKLIPLSYTVGLWDLLVIPPETGAAAAARLMSAAATPGGLVSASGLRASEDTRDASEARSREEEWETEGGAASEVRNPVGLPASARGR